MLSESLKRIRSEFEGVRAKDAILHQAVAVEKRDTMAWVDHLLAQGQIKHDDLAIDEREFEELRQHYKQLRRFLEVLAVNDQYTEQEEQDYVLM